MTVRSTKSPRVVVSADQQTRLAAATDWLSTKSTDAEVLVVAASWESCDDLVRGALSSGGARFGITRLTLDHLATRLAAPALAADGRIPVTGLALTALAARAIHRLLAEDGISYFAPVATRPGFSTAIAGTLEELRMNDVAASALCKLAGSGRDLAALAEALESELAGGGLADRAEIFRAAVRGVAGATVDPLVGVPLLLLDVACTSGWEAGLIESLARGSDDVLATVPAGDARAIELIERALGCEVGSPRSRKTTGGRRKGAARSLATLKEHLFGATTGAQAPLDDSVVFCSWPGEARECVEIARGIQTEAARGVPFDRMAVFLRSPNEYGPHIEEAFRRAAIPGFFALGTARPHPAGRALLSLLACAGEGLSARRFAEYLSLAQVPDPDAPHDRDTTFVPPALDLFPETFAEKPLGESSLANPETRSVIAGSVRAPWRWERLLVDAAVIGGKERWERRLRGLEEELRLRREEIRDDEESRAALIERQLADLGHLRAFAVPLIERLGSLPGRAPWGEWLEHLRGLAGAALREPAGVLQTLAMLNPMAPVGPVDLDEVRLVLTPHLRELRLPPPRRRHGAVLVAPTDAARGLAFDVVFVPGLAEKLFPRKIIEDPILLDAQRESLGLTMLARQADRVAAERLRLRLAVGAARRRLYLSYPRMDIQQGRPRVPSFYGLEALRAAEGYLPGFDELGARAGSESPGRLGWPAPERPEDAIDEAEYDLSLLSPLLDTDPSAAAGAASYLLTANSNLARALRARARRWLFRWTPADGLVDADGLALDALKPHRPRARSFSPTALQHFALCPYRFFLQAVHRIQPREEARAIEVMDPLTRGALFHDVQFTVLTRLRADRLLPVTPETLDVALAAVDDALSEIADRYVEKLAPAIPRVWDDGINTVRADLREWMRRQADSDEGWIPDRFELSFGLADRDGRHADPASEPKAVAVRPDLNLRGSIDLVERHPRGVLRVTDHKTGKVRAAEHVIIGGGTVLQPVLYALAAERLLGEPVAAGRLYYCTADGGYVERVVPLDGAARASVDTLTAIIDRALAEGFLPAVPAENACRYCDYRPVCGPYEDIRTARKPRERLGDLLRLRALP